jgi:hypothetical protein
MHMHTPGSCPRPVPTVAAYTRACVRRRRLRARRPSQMSTSAASMRLWSSAPLSTPRRRCSWMAKLSSWATTSPSAGPRVRHASHTHTRQAEECGLPEEPSPCSLLSLLCAPPSHSLPLPNPRPARSLRGPQQGGGSSAGSGGAARDAAGGPAGCRSRRAANAPGCRRCRRAPRAARSAGAPRAAAASRHRVSRSGGCGPCGCHSGQRAGVGAGIFGAADAFHRGQRHGDGGNPGGHRGLPGCEDRGWGCGGGRRGGQGRRMPGPRLQGPRLCSFSLMPSCPPLPVRSLVCRLSPLLLLLLLPFPPLLPPLLPHSAGHSGRGGTRALCRLGSQTLGFDPPSTAPSGCHLRGSLPILGLLSQQSVRVQLVPPFFAPAPDHFY